LDNDFYIGTLRQGKYTRQKINGKDVKRDELDHIVIEHHYQAIIDYRTVATTCALREKRTRSNYRGIKKYDNVYSGFLECGDCGSPMFAMSRSDLKPAYTCGTYHRRGLAECTSHHIRTDRLDELLKSYVQKVMENSAPGLLRPLENSAPCMSLSYAELPSQFSIHLIRCVGRSLMQGFHSFCQLSIQLRPAHATDGNRLCGRQTKIKGHPFLQHDLAI
jgi:hypothetical protein